MIIAVEGVSCTGKSTLAASLARLLTCEVIGCYYHVADDPSVLGEPLVTSEAEQLASLGTHLVIEQERQRRAQTALAGGGPVIMDRSVDTLLAHLGAVGRIQGLDATAQARALVDKQVATGGVVLPDLTLVLAADPQALESRAAARPDLPTLYYDPVFTAYFNHHFANPISPRCVWLNASLQPDEVLRAALAYVESIPAMASGRR
ncbi:dTMP kinase [Nonomuraea typhae]|uniref:dTMP kinase n=1 Tax=Nonomuraea typhae TaxID=2603600 RepID=A0ABW7YLQ3_9ACTN